MRGARRWLRNAAGGTAWVVVAALASAAGANESLVQRVLGASRSVVYVLPETRTVQGLLRALEPR